MPNSQDFLAFKSVSGRFHRAGLVGDGVQNIFRIAYAIFESQEENVILLDEPELSLHPQGQRALYEELRSKSKTAQIVVATHSPYFVSWADIQHGAKVYRTSLVKDVGASIRTATPDTIKRIAGVATEKKNRKLYDVVAKELFFSRGCLFVEGQEDAHIISNYIDEQKKEPIEIFGYGSGGSSHICSWLTLANDLGIRAAALYDSDEAGTRGYEEANKKFAKNQNIMVRKLPTQDIRDKRDLKKAGIFDEDWKIKGFQKDWFDGLLHQFATFLTN